MKIARKNRDTVRSEEIIIKVTSIEKRAVMAAADQHGLTMSAWIRMVLNEKINQK